MDFSTIKDLATNKAARSLLITKKHSPKILFVAGTVGVVTATVLACRATLKVSGVLDNHDKSKMLLLGKLSGKFQPESEQISQEVHDEQLKKLKLETAIQIVKPYLPAVGVGLVSIAALTGSHVILSRRNSAIGATLAALNMAHNQYRQNVVTEFGADTDRRFATSETEMVEERLADGTTVTRATATKTSTKSPYTHIFDETSKYFSTEPGRNAVTLQMKQSEVNTALRARGHMTMNDVLRRLGLPVTPEGFQVGWVYKPNDPNHKGDNEIDFGIFKGDEEMVEAFFDGEYYWAVLDLNCDPGTIYANL